MAAKKHADLRLLKDGVVFGPTDRQGLEKLLAAGRITTEDRVSVRNADWIRIGDYLAAPAASPSKTAVSPSPVEPAPRRKKGDLQVLADGRVISALHRDDVERLWKAARLGDDDLICALGGPWMRVGDFFAPPAPPEPVAPAPPAPSVDQQPAAPTTVPISVTAPTPMPIPVPLPQPGPTPAVAPVPVPPTVVSPQLGAEVVQPSAMSSPGGYRVRAMPPPPTSTSDEWFVRVRGVHSAPLRKYHVKALFQAREITLDNVARHPTWAENDWRPIISIPALADIGRS